MRENAHSKKYTFMKTVDMHCHILPGIDDGARDLDMSRQMLRLEAREGTDTIIFTPHFKPDHHNASPETICLMTERMQKIADDEGLKLNLYPGNEILYFSDVPELLMQGEVLTLAGSDQALIEFYPFEPYEMIRAGLYEVLAAGFTPVLAHVERYVDLVKKPAYIEELVRMGVRIQVNASSITGRYGLGIKWFLSKLLRKQLVEFVSTDAHNMERRAPLLKECAELVSKKYGKEYAGAIFHDNARELIVEGNEIYGGPDYYHEGIITKEPFHFTGEDGPAGREQGRGHEAETYEDGPRYYRNESEEKGA